MKEEAKKEEPKKGEKAEEVGVCLLRVAAAFGSVQSILPHLPLSR